MVKTKPKKQSKPQPQQKMQTNSNKGVVPITTSGQSVTDLMQRPTGRNNMFKRNLGHLIPSLSRDGLTFLKAVFAAPDFAGQGKFNGIPDEVAYNCLKYRHVFNADMWATFVASATQFGGVVPGAGTDILIFQPPVPGVAFYWGYVSAGANVVDATTFYPVTYNDFAQVFGSNIDQQPGTPGPPAVPQLDNFVNAFRFAGNSIEMICTTNAFTWTGSIAAFKGTCGFTDTKTYVSLGASQSKSLSGLENFNNRGMTSTYVAPSNLGVYMSAVNREPTFESSTVCPDLFQVNANQPQSTGSLTGSFPGCGSLETNFIRISGLQYSGGVPTTNFQFRCWSVLEYTPVEGTVFSNVSTPNPPLDAAALEIYRSIVADLPIAVTYAENDTFWKKLLGIVGSVGKALTVIPGWGAIAGGVGMAADAASSLIR
jgi:hypothetical protein